VELSIYLEILKRRAWVIAFVTMLAILIVSIIGLIITPLYTAQSTVRVISDAGLADFTFREDYSERLQNTYREVLLSPPFIQEALTRTGVNPATVDMALLLTQVNVEVVSKTELMNISVENSDPAFARDLSNHMAELLEEYPQNLYVGRGKSTAQIVEAQLSEIQTQLEADRQELSDARAQGRSAAEIADIESRIKFQEDSYTKLLDNYEMVRLNQSLRANSISVLAPATLPSEPSNNLGLTELALALALGLMGGVAVALVIENLDTRIHSAQQIEYMTNMPVFGVVPHGIVTPGTFEQAESSSPVQTLKEAYRMLIPNMKIFTKRDTSLRSILVTSPTGGDSKSLVAANLAQAIAEQGQQIFLVEADLRSPSLEKVFAVESEFGLSDLLDRSAVLDQLVHPTAQPNLFMINAGKKVKNPTTLLASSAMRRFLDILENREQFIIVNAPAVLGVADASVLAANMSGVILVVSEESNNREQIFAALRQLQAARARMMGIIYVKKDQKGWGLS